MIDYGSFSFPDASFSDRNSWLIDQITVLPSHAFNEDHSNLVINIVDKSLLNSIESVRKQISAELIKNPNLKHEINNELNDLFIKIAEIDSSQHKKIEREVSISVSAIRSKLLEACYGTSHDMHEVLVHAYAQRSKIDENQFVRTWNIVSELVTLGNQITINNSSLFLDLDGVIIQGGKAKTGALDLFSFLDDKNFPFVILTNSNNRTHQQQVDRLKVIPELENIFIKSHDYIVPADAAYHYITSRKEQANVFFLFGGLGMREPFIDSNHTILELDKKSALTVERVDYIVVGDVTDNDEKMIDLKIAKHLLMTHRECVCLIAIDDPLPNKHTYSQWRPTVSTLGNVLRRELEKPLKSENIDIHDKFVIVGKPHKAIFDIAKEKVKRAYDTNPLFSLMVGDTLKTDIYGGNHSGCVTVFVKTGTSRLQELSMLSKQYYPDFIIDSVDQVKSLIEKKQ